MVAPNSWKFNADLDRGHGLSAYPETANWLTAEADGAQGSALSWPPRDPRSG